MGRTGGGVFNTTLRKLPELRMHGSLFGALQETDWLANNFFSNRAGQPIAPTFIRTTRDSLAIPNLERSITDGVAVGLELVELEEGARVEEQLDPLARGQLAVRVLFIDAILAAAELGPRVKCGEAFAGREIFFGHGGGKLLRGRRRGKGPREGQIERAPSRSALR